MKSGDGDGSRLLEDLGEFLRRFVRFGSPAQIDVLALWVLHTYAMDAAWATPYVLVHSVEKRSGKTRLLEVLELVVHEPRRTASISAAALYRSVAQGTTLMIDEIDTAFGDRRSERGEDLRCVLNAGYKKGGIVMRATKDGAVEPHPTFCPKVIAGIDNHTLPDTVRDRCIPIRMHRSRADDEPLERFIEHRLMPACEELRQRAAGWAERHVAVLKNSEPDYIEELDDRAAEITEALLAIADAVAGPWPERARSAVAALMRERGAEEDSLGVKLLGDLRAVYGDSECDRLSTADLLARLTAIETAPSATYGRTRKEPGLRPRDLALLLEPYGIKSTTVRLAPQTTLKGYKVEDFEDAFARYLPAHGATGVTPVTSETAAHARSPLAAPSDTEVTDVTHPPARVHVSPARPRMRSPFRDRVSSDRPTLDPTTT